MRAFRTWVALASFGLMLGISESVMACAVCFGDPNSNMVKGASAGIFVLLGVIISVLMSIVAVTLFWARRARAIREIGTVE